MRCVWKWALSGLILLFAGCAPGQSDVKDENMSIRNIEEPIYQILKTAQVPVDRQEYMHGQKAYLVYHSDDGKEVEAFNAEYRKLTGEEAPLFEGTVIIAKTGTQKTGGYGYELQEISDSGRTLEVVLKLQKPGEIATMALTNPYIVILLPQIHGEVKVVEAE